MQQVEQVFSIPAADVRLYASDADGNPSGSPVWSAKCFDQVRVVERKLQKKTMPTGARFPVTHDINEEHEIQIDGLMDIDTIPGRNTYWVLYIQWLQATPSTNGQWRSRTYFGTTHRSLDSAGRGGNEIAQTQLFTSQFYHQDRGTGTPGGPSAFETSSL